MATEKIWRDLSIIEGGMAYLSEHQGINHQVTDENYLEPDLDMNIVVPMNHSSGLFMYFRKIRAVLKKAVEKGFLEECELPENAPQYLEELVR